MRFVDLRSKDIRPQMNADGRGCFRMAVFVVVCGIGWAQEGPYRAGNGVSVPVVVQKAEPEYTEGLAWPASTAQ
jgi:hypothetical protein